MQQARRESRIRRAEVNSKIERAGEPVARRDNRRAVVVAVEADIRGGDCDRGEDVDFVVGPVGRLRVDGDSLDDVRAVDVVRARGPDRVVGAVEGHAVVGRAGPGDVAEGADDGDYLRVGVGRGEDDGVVAREVAIVAAVGRGGVVLGEGEEGEGEG